MSMRRFNVYLSGHFVGFIYEESIALARKYASQRWGRFEHIVLKERL